MELANDCVIAFLRGKQPFYIEMLGEFPLGRAALIFWKISYSCERVYR